MHLRHKTAEHPHAQPAGHQRKAILLSQKSIGIVSLNLQSEIIIFVMPQQHTINLYKKPQTEDGFIYITKTHYVDVIFFSTFTSIFRHVKVSKAALV